jgi:hypothetical protein
MDTLPAWLIYADIIGTVSVLGGFAVLFWTGRIVSKATMDKFLSLYESQMKATSNGFLKQMQEVANQQTEAVVGTSKSVDRLIEAFEKQLEESRESRGRMVESVASLRVAIAERTPNRKAR